jgi:hypothetical protein
MEGGGPIESITIKGRRFACDGEDSGKIQLGGFNNELKPNGDGTARQIKSRKLATITDLNPQCDPSRGDLEYLQGIQSSFEMADTAVTLVDGTVYSGAMQITDEVEYDAKEGTCGLSMAGYFEKQ